MVVKWIIIYGDLIGVVAYVDEIKGKVGDSLREYLDGVRFMGWSFLVIFWFMVFCG